MKLNSKELQDAYKMVRQRARSNLIDYQIATNPNYEPNWHHLVIAKELEHIEAFGDRDYKILIVDVPPRHGKSQQISIDFPTWYLGRNPDKEIIEASYSFELAQDFGGKSREKVDSEAFGYIFPDVKLRSDEKARGRWRTAQGGAYTSAGVGGPITGKGANIILVDDPIKNREEAESEVYREKTWNWFISTAFTRLAPNGVAIVIATRWNLDDLSGRLLSHPELKGRIKHIHFAAISEKDELPYRGIGEALWPTRYPLPALLEIRSTLGPYDWSSLYQGNPVLTENQEFKPEWIRRIDEGQVSMMNCRRMLTVDTAMSKKTQADFTAFVDNRVNQENFWHIKAWQAKLGPEELVDALFSLHASNRYESIGIERTSYLDGLKPYLDSEQRKRNKFLPIVELKHNQTSKEIRIRGLIPHYSSRSIFHINNECKILEEQMTHFPVGVHDDILDALAYQTQLLAQDASSAGRNVKVKVFDI